MTELDPTRRLSPSYRMICNGLRVSDRRRYIYVSLAKSACTTVKQALWDWEVAEGAAQPPSNSRELHGKGFWDPHYALERGYFTFSFVRNPYARALSCYLNKIARRTVHRQKFCLQHGIDFAAEISFRDFLTAINGSTPDIDDPHWRSQYHTLLNGSLAVDWLGSVEHMDDDMSFLGSRLGFAYRRAAVANATHASERLAQYYGETEKRLVLDKYGIDFELLGYGTDIAEPAPRRRHLAVDLRNREGACFVRATGLRDKAPEEALDLCRQAVASGALLQPYSLLLELLQRLGRPRALDETLGVLTARGDLPAEVDAAVAKACLRRKDLTLAARHAELAASKDRSDYHMLNARILSAMGRHDGAIKSSRAAAQAARGSLSSLILQAQMMLRAGRLERCLAVVERVLSREPDSGEARRLQKRALARLKNRAGRGSRQHARV